MKPTNPELAKPAERWRRCLHPDSSVRMWPTRHRCEICGTTTAELLPDGTWRQVLMGRSYIVRPLLVDGARHPNLARAIAEGQGYDAAMLTGAKGATYTLWAYAFDRRGRPDGWGRIYASGNFDRPQHGNTAFRVTAAGYLEGTWRASQERAASMATVAASASRLQLVREG